MMGTSHPSGSNSSTGCGLGGGGALLAAVPPAALPWVAGALAGSAATDGPGGADLGFAAAGAAVVGVLGEPEEASLSGGFAAPDASPARAVSAASRLAAFCGSSVVIGNLRSHP